MKWQHLLIWCTPVMAMVAFLGGIAIPTGESAFYPPSRKAARPTQNLSPKKLPNQQSVEQIQQLAQAITVKVLSKEVLGSGILIKQEAQIYTVLTNAHVLRVGSPPYRIQTSDGRIYLAEVLKDVRFQDNDLALLQFVSNGDTYTVAKVGVSSTLSQGDEVFAAGFPFAVTTSQEKGFVFTTGQFLRVLDKALVGGYQIGYTNDIQKGMSGGPLLNRHGEVVGVNGKHAYPLWDAPEMYKDGSTADRSLQELITRASWAVPMETVANVAPFH